MKIFKSIALAFITSVLVFSGCGSNAGLELVTIHDRPEGSKLGKYNYIIEVEVPDGITDQQISKICKNVSIRFCGSFNTVSK